MPNNERQILLDFDAITPRAILLLTPDEAFQAADERVVAELHETSIWERKRAAIHRNELAKYYSMWANTSPFGGLIAIGIEEDGMVTGCVSADQSHLNSLERVGPELCSDTRHDIKRVPVTNNRGESDYVLLVRVFYHDGKVVETTSGDAWIRRGDSKFRLDPDQKRELAIDKG